LPRIGIIDENHSFSTLKLENLNFMTSESLLSLIESKEDTELSKKSIEGKFDF